MWLEVVVDENAVADATGRALERQGDQVAETSARQGVLTRKEPIIGTEPEVGASIHGVGEQHGPQPPREACWHGLIEEDPHMSAVAGTGPFQRGGNARFPTGEPIGQCIRCPGPTVEIHRHEVAGLVE